MKIHYPFNIRYTTYLAGLFLSALLGVGFHLLNKVVTGDSIGLSQVTWQVWDGLLMGVIFIGLCSLFKHYYVVIGAVYLFYMVRLIYAILYEFPIDPKQTASQNFLMNAGMVVSSAITWFLPAIFFYEFCRRVHSKSAEVRL